MQTIVDIINEQQKGLPKTTRPGAAGRDRAQERGICRFGLSCFICPNDPDEPTVWRDEEITGAGPGYNATRTNLVGAGRRPLLQLALYHFFTLFYNDSGGQRARSVLNRGRIMLDRIQRAIFEGRSGTGRRVGKLHRNDDYGCHLVRR